MNIRSLRFGATVAISSFAIIASAVSFAPTTYATHGVVNTNETNIDIKINNQSEQNTDKNDAAKTQERLNAERADNERKRIEAQESNAKRNAAKEKLSATKLEICNTRKATIDHHVARIADRTEKHLELFDSIAEKTQAFYIDKGYLLDNYDALSSEIARTKDAATTAVDSLVTQKNVFDCESDDPKGTIATYKAMLNDTIDALNSYKSSIKNLIVSIKSVNATEVGQ